MLGVHGTKREVVSLAPHLPQELVSNILSRLPAIDLVKCKSVCKSWFDLITDSHFVSNYYVAYNNLKHYQSQEEKLLVIGRPFVSALKTHISLLSCNTNNPKKNHVSSSLSNLPCEYNNSEHKYWSEISGPCNGIYFLEGNPNVLMNPSLGQFKALPKSHLSASQGTYSLTEYSGFGFDLKNNDYKVVVIRDIWLKETDERKQGHWTAELYSLNSNSWRKLDDASLPHPIEIWGSSRVYTYANNCYHWWGHDVDESGVKEDAVLAFDMVNDSFRKIKVPIIRGSSKEEFATLAPLKESATIGVVVYPLRGQEKSFDVWIMKNYWDEGSWVKQYTVEPIEAIYKFVGFYGSNQFPWSSCNEGLGWYDYEPATEKIKDLQVWGNNGSLRAARYMESLVSLRRGMSSVANLF